MSFGFFAVPVLFFTLLLPVAASAQNVSDLLAAGDSAQLRMDPRSALDAYRQAERLAPRNAEVLWRLSKVISDIAAMQKDEKRAREQLRRALRFAERAVEGDPSNAMAQVSLAISHGQLAVIAPASEKLELSKKVKEHSERALQLDPSNHIAMLVLGMWNREVASLSWVLKLAMRIVYGGVPEASLEESRRLLTQAATHDPQSIMMHLELAKTLIELKERQTAVTHLQRAIALPQRDIGDPARLVEARKLLRELT
jgi:tetratricopeptide (TPR) repeat protein